MTATNKQVWSADAILTKLRAAPAPLRTDDDASAFYDAIAMIQDAPSAATRRKIAAAASHEMIRVVDATVRSKRRKQFESEVLFALKLMAYMGTKEGVACICRVAKLGYEADSYMWSVALTPFGEGHPMAPVLFKALSKPLPEKFLAISLLDAVNSAAREHKLKAHPFDSAAGASRLATYLASRKSHEASYAVSACAAIPFISKSRRARLVALARKHKDPSIRMEVAWATAKLGEKAGLEYLTEKCLDRNTSRQASHYLAELGKKKLIPRAVREPDFAAMAEMCDWLQHPNEYGEPPDRIELLDKRTIFWPPTRDTRELRLFSFVYEANRNREERAEGVGMVGSMTWSFFEDTKPTMKPELIYGHHCCFELEAKDDPRAPKKRSGKAGWALISGGN
jgi:hypothetical protein